MNILIFVASSLLIKSAAASLLFTTPSPLSGNNHNSIKPVNSPMMKRAEEVPPYGIVDDDDIVLVNGRLPGQTNTIGNQKRDPISIDFPSPAIQMKTCMVYVIELLNIICNTDNWLYTSHYTPERKRRILSRCCQAPCSTPILATHCRRRNEADLKHEYLNSLPVDTDWQGFLDQQLAMTINNNNRMKNRYAGEIDGYFGNIYDNPK